MMKRNIIYNKVVGLALAALTFTACSDTWDEHYDAATDATIGVNAGSLWQAISSNAELSNFASVVKACDYDLRLGSSQVFTVFAPLNSQFSKAEADRLIAQYQQEKNTGVRQEDNTVVKEFLQNHIALYNHSVSDVMEPANITMMNGKYQQLTKSLFGGSQLVSKSGNLYDNGLLFTIDKQVEFFPNIFEYMTKDPDLDSLRSFLYNSLFYELKFQESQSVAGGLNEAGQTVYLDSVFELQNELFDIMNAEINNEDSTYWMIAPTNDVWSRLIEEYTPYFNYDPAVGDLLEKGTPDSLAYTNIRRAIVDGLFFSRTTNTDRMLADSAMSTQSVLEYTRRNSRWGSDTLAYYQYMKPQQAPTGIFTGTTNVECSNGIVMKADDWKVKPTQTFARTLIFEAERCLKERGTQERNGVKIETTTPYVYNVTRDNPYYSQISGHSFVEYHQELTTYDHNVTFNLTNVLSNMGYDIYLVVVPALASDTLARNIDRAPYKLCFTLGYHDAEGKEQTLMTTDRNGLATEADSVQHVLVAENFKFPICSYGVSEAIPQATLRVETKVRSSELRQGLYQRTMRIDCIILKPHEED